MGSSSSQRSAARHDARVRTDPAIIVMAKAPVAGRVKTRCCPPCTPHQAAALAQAALVDSLRAVASTGASRLVLALDGKPGPWLADGFEVIGQRGRGLGQRIDNAFFDVGQPALLIGMDTPQVSAGLLDHALDGLRRRTTDAVVGPSADGGFWALGLVDPADGLCAAVPMSSPATVERLRAGLAGRELSYRSLDMMVDVDDFATALAVAADAPGSRFAGVVGEIESTLGPVTVGMGR